VRPVRIRGGGGRKAAVDLGERAESYGELQRALLELLFDLAIEIPEISS
jgi:hypothetical protein